MSFPGRAAGTGSSVKNVTQGTSADVLSRKQVIVGSFDPLKTSLAVETPFLSLSPEFTADQTGFGSMLHRLHLKNNLAANGIETWIQPQAEAGGAAAAVGEIDFTGATGVLAGTLYMYLAGDPVPVVITAAMTVEEIADAVVAAATAKPELNVILTKTAVTFEVVVTSKTKGTYGNDVDVSFNLGVNQSFPVGIAGFVAVTQPTSGTGLPDITTALDALGTGDGANGDFFTALIHGYGQDSTTLDAILAYVGAGNDFIGLYGKTVHRPFRSLTGDTATGSAGLAAQIVISDGRLEDRAQGVISVPGSQSHPSEIAAQALGFAENVNDQLGQGDYVDGLLIGVQPGAIADRWTDDYDDRDIAVNNGIGTTLVKAGSVFIQDMVTFYRPASIPADSNGYRDFANISITQNILNSENVFFSNEKHKNLIIVADIAKVTDPVARLKVRDVATQMGFVIQLVKNWEAIGWIFSAEYTINKLKEGGFITVNVVGNGFTNRIPTIYSGKGKIMDTTTEFDTSFAAVL